MQWNSAVLHPKAVLCAYVGTLILTKPTIGRIAYLDKDT